MPILSTAGGYSIGEERVGLGGVELERVSGVGDSDDPVAESQQARHQRSSDESSAVQDDAGRRDRAKQPVF